MSDEKPSEPLPALRKTGTMRHAHVQEVADPSGRRPVAQWVVSGSVARPAHEVLPAPSGGVPAHPPARPGWWMLAVAAATGFAVAIPVTWIVFSYLAR